MPSVPRPTILFRGHLLDWLSDRRKAGDFRIRSCYGLAVPAAGQACRGRFISYGQQYGDYDHSQTHSERRRRKNPARLPTTIFASTKFQLIDAEGENRGVTDTQDARRMAEDAGLDLVLISPNAKPPVAKILDLGKLKYEQQKKAARRTQEAKDRRGQGSEDAARISTPTTMT